MSISTALLNKFISLRGQKVTIIYPSFIEGVNNAVKCTIQSTPFPHGYITPGGGWCLYDSSGQMARSYSIKIRKYRHRNSSRFQIDDVIDVVEGW